MLNISLKYIYGRDNYTCQNERCKLPLKKKEIFLKRLHQNGEEIESNVVISCGKCLIEKTGFASPIRKFTGRLVVVTGPMYSQKSTITRSFYNKYKAFSPNHIWVKPKTDNRELGHTKTHDGELIEALTIDPDRPDTHLQVLKKYDVVAIDEVQFFSNRILFVVRELLASGTLVIVNGLKLTAKRDLFGSMAYLLAEADEIISLKAVCNICGIVDFATRTKSFNNKSPSIETGGSEKYYAVCSACDGADNEAKFIKNSYRE